MHLTPGEAACASAGQWHTGGDPPASHAGDPEGDFTELLARQAELEAELTVACAHHHQTDSPSLGSQPYRHRSASSHSATVSGPAAGTPSWRPPPAVI